MTTTKREPKEEKSTTYASPLTPDAFIRPAESKEEKAERDQFIHTIYKQEPVYDHNKPLFHTQIELLANQLKKIAEEYKDLNPADVANISHFPQYFKQLIEANPETVGISSIVTKSSLEKLIFKLQKKIIVDKEKLRQRLNERKLSETELQIEYELEQKDAADYEARKLPCLANLLPYILKCDTGITGHIDFALEYMSGGNSLEDAWCQMRTKYVTDFGFRHLEIFKKSISEGSEIHVPVVLRNHALEKKWGIRSEMENVKDHFRNITQIDDEVLAHFEVGFCDVYTLRSMAEEAAKKFENLLFRSRKIENHYEWITEKDSKLIYDAEDLLKKWSIEESGSMVFDKKEDGSIRFNPQLFKQVFWQSCRKNERYVKKDCWIEEKVFKEYQLYQCKIPGQESCAWIEDNKGELVSFGDLPDTEKRRYFSYSIVKSGFPDRLDIVKNIFDIFKEKKDYEVLAKELQENKPLEKHRSLLIHIFQNEPQHFYTLLNTFDENVREKALDFVDVTYHWLHPNSDLHETLVKSIPKDTWVEAHYKKIKQLFEQFQKDHKAETTPIRFSTLLEIAKTAKPDDPIFKMYLQRYFPYEYRQEAVEEKPNYPKSFLTASDIKHLEDEDQQLIVHIRNGDLKALEKLPLKDLYFHAAEIHRFQHQHVLKYFYKKAWLAVVQGESPKKTTLLYWLVLLNQRKSEDAARILENPEINSNKGSDDGITPLHLASVLNLKNWIIDLLKFKSTNINAKNEDIQTPLYAALEKGNLDVVRILLENGANVNLAIYYGITPLYFAVDTNNLEAVRLLLEKGAYANLARDSYYTPLYVAAKNGNTEIVRLLLEKGAQASLTTKGHTPLFAAAQYGHLDVVRLLVDHGAQINLGKNINSLFIAAQNGHFETVRYLLENGALINLPDSEGETALHIATKRRHIEIVKLLLKAGANPTLLYKGETPYQIATDPVTKNLLLAAEAKFLKKEIQEEKFSTNYKLLHAKDSDQYWLEDQKGEVVIFNQLSKAEQLRYFIDSIVKTGFPDQFHLLKPSPTLFQALQDKKQWAFLASALKAYNQWDTQKSLLKFILCERPHYFMIMLETIKDEATRSKIMDCVDINFSLLHPQDSYHESIKNLPMQTDDDALGVWVAERLNQKKAAFKKFQEDYKLDPAITPILFTKLLEIAPKAKPEDQFIFKMYLQYYFPQDYHRTIQQETPNFAATFLKAYQSDFKEANKQLCLSILNGDIKALREMKVTFEDYYKNHYSGTFIQQPTLDYFYTIAARAYEEKNSLYNAPLLYLMVSCNQQPEKNKSVEALLAVKELNVNEFGDNGSTALHAAAAFGFINWIKRLCNFREINIDAKDKTGATPLICAVKLGNTEVVRLLLEKGAQVNIARDDTQTPLHMATRYGFLEIVRLLLENGAHVDQTAQDGYTALFGAAQEGFVDIVRLLLEKKAQINLASNQGVTPLNMAAMQGHTKVVRLLLEKGADIELASKNGSTPLFIAVHNGHLEPVKLLLEAGANPTRIYLGKTLYQRAKDPAIKALLLAAEIKYELQKITATEAKDKPTFFSPKNAELIQGIQMLRAFLNSDISKKEFLELKFNENNFKTEPWKSFYKETMVLLPSLPDQPTKRAEKKT